MDELEKNGVGGGGGRLADVEAEAMRVGRVYQKPPATPPSHHNSTIQVHPPAGSGAAVAVLATANANTKMVWLPLRARQRE